MLNSIKNKVLYKKFVAVIFILSLITEVVYAQPPVEPCVLDPNATGCPGDPDLPLDGGLSILLVAGALYGIKKLKDKRFE